MHVPSFFLSRQGKNTWLAVGLLWLGLWFGSYLGITQPAMGWIERMHSPLQQQLVSMAVSIKMQLWQVVEMWSAEQAVSQLRQENRSLRVALVHLQALEAENQALRKMIENTDRKLQKTVLAAPIISFGQPALAAGTEDGVKKDMMVIVREQLLGFVTEVTTHQAVVSLLQHPQTRPVLATTQAGAVGLVQGENGQLWLREIPIDQKVSEGELVYTVGQIGVSPRLLIGKVVLVESQPSAAVQTIRLQQNEQFFDQVLLELR